MVFFADPTTEITVFAIIIAIILFAIQRVFGSKKVKERQKGMKEKQKQLKELMKKNDEQSKQKVAQLQKEMLSDSAKMFKESFGDIKALRPMIISAIIVLPVLWWMQSVYGTQYIPLPFDFPILGTDCYWFWWYIVVGFIVGIVLQIITGMAEKMIGKKPAEKKKAMEEMEKVKQEKEEIIEPKTIEEAEENSDDNELEMGA